MFKKGKLLGLSLVLGLGHSMWVAADLPPARFILETWLKKHQLSHGQVLKVKLGVTATLSSNDAPVNFVETFWIYPALTPPVLRSVWTDQQGKRLGALEKSWASLAPVSQLLLGNALSTVVPSLQQKGLDLDAPKVATVSLMPYQGDFFRLAWKLSSANPGPFLLFAQDLFVPLEFSYGPNHYQFEFQGILPTDVFPYPKVIQVKKDKQILFVCQRKELALLPQKQEDFFANGIHFEKSENGIWEAILREYETLFR